MSLWSGQGVGLIRTVELAGHIVREMATEVPAIVGRGADLSRP